MSADTKPDQSSEVVGGGGGAGNEKNNIETPTPESKEEREPVIFDNSIDPKNEVRGAKLILIHTALCLCTFLVGLDFNLIAVAIPEITTDFNSISDVGWYGAAFQLGLCTTQTLAGKTFVLFSKKYTYLSYLALFEVGSLVCALAPSSNALIVGRVIAGVGASGIFAGGFAILTAIVPLHKRSIFTGTINSTFAIASIIGPIIGGAFTQRVTWRWCFWINLPIGGLSGLACLVLLRLNPAETQKVRFAQKMKSLDGIGFALFAGAVTMLLLALQWGGVEFAWNSSVVVGLLVGAVVTFALFVPWQLRMDDDALIPPKVFSSHRNIGLICASAFFINGPFQSVIYWLPIWFQTVLGVGPLESGTLYLPTVISDVLAAFIGSALVMQVGYWNPFLLVAEAFAALGGGLLSTIYPSISLGHLIGYQIFGGVGYSLATAMVHIALQSSMPKELVPIGSSTLLTVISISCSVFLAVGQLIFQNRLFSNLSPLVSKDTIDEIIRVGARNIATVVGENDYPAVIEGYGKSITQVFYLTAAAPVISFFLVCGCTWISTKTAHQQRDEETTDKA
ncbi:major facilitator superfamily domain-containing protein [Poronia punctata]|nr:major facilitator superfamily domain-containing protein [Poronia punctata]